MKSLLVFTVLIGNFLFGAFSQNNQKVKLVVGVVVDQMRYDYVENFSPFYSDNGFNRLINEGYSFSAMKYNYKPTYTGPGHASIYTGATPSIHGIVGNNWYSRNEKQAVYCVKLSTDSGEVLSPQRMLSESIADVIKSSSTAKVYGVALKDRGAILPAGHHADGAYWLNSKTGQWESSSYYPNQFPVFLETVNKIDFKAEALKQNWTLAPKLIGKKVDWFKDGDSLKLQHFNHDLKAEFKEHSWGLLKSIPYGNELTAEFAMRLIESEGLGLDEQLDFLSLSFSATDYVGHTYGVESSELVDTYVQLDQTLGTFIDFLDEQVGENNYLLFLSSDHGAGFSREFLMDRKQACGQLNLKNIKNELDSVLDKNFGEQEWIVSMHNLNVYMNDDLDILSSVVDYNTVLKVASNYLLSVEGIDQVITPTNYKAIGDISQLIQMSLNGYLKTRSGDLILLESPNWTTYSDDGSTHGSPYDYDTHVPFFLYGNSIENGQSARAVNIIDIAPTVCHLLGIRQPKESSGAVITEF